MKNNYSYCIWKCLSCGKINYSIPQRHHQMDVCKCDNSGMDLDIYLCTIMGEVKVIENLDFNFFGDLVNCMEEQGYLELVSVNDMLFINWEQAEMIRDMEDEILTDYITKYGEVNDDI